MAPKTSKRPRPRPLPEDGSVTGMMESTLAPKTSKRPRPRPNRAPKDSYQSGGMVRGCKPDQMSGKGFSGSY